MKTTGIAPSLGPLSPRPVAARPAAATIPPTATVLHPLGAAASGRAQGACGATTAWQPLAAAPGDDRRQALAAVKEFEAVFLRQLAGVMTRSASGLTEGSEGAAFYQGMIEEQLGRLLAECGGGMGLQDALLARLAGQGEGVADAAR